MSHFLQKQPHELMIDFADEFERRINRPIDLESAEMYFLKKCYNLRNIVIDNSYMERYHLRNFSSNNILIEKLSLNNQAHRDTIEAQLGQSDTVSLLSASYKLDNNDWHCSPVGKDSSGFYLIQTFQNSRNAVGIQDLSAILNIQYIDSLGDCLLISITNQ